MSETSVRPLVPDHPFDRPFTRQEIFNRAWQWAVVEKHDRCVAENDYTFCRYRAADGQNACLIGCLIPDSRYSRKMDEAAYEKGVYPAGSVDPDMLRDYGLTDLVAVEDADFCAALQDCHDDAKGAPTYGQVIEFELRKFARRWHVDIPGEALV